MMNIVHYVKVIQLTRDIMLPKSLALKCNTLMLSSILKLLTILIATLEKTRATNSNGWNNVKPFEIDKESHI